MNILPGSHAPELLKLEEEHEAKRKETLQTLEALENARRHALIQLQKTQIVFKYLNWKQQERIENLCGGIFSLQRIYSVANTNSGYMEESALPAAFERTASYLQRVKTTRKNILHFGIIQARAAELIEAIIISVSAFNHQYKTTNRELFPLGFISRIMRSIRKFFNHYYISWQEISCLENLGITAGYVLKMAEVPVSGNFRQNPQGPGSENRRFPSGDLHRDPQGSRFPSGAGR